MNIRPEDMANKVEDWMTDSARAEALALRWHVTGQEVAPIMGPLAAQWWQQFLEPSDPTEILHQLEYRIEAGSARKPNKQRDAQNMKDAMTNLLPILVTYAQATGDMSQLNRLLTDWAKSIDLDPTGYLLQPPPMPGFRWDMGQTSLGVQ